MTRTALCDWPCTKELLQMDQMDRKADDYWGSLLLAMVWDARQEGDLVTAELLLEEAMRYFDEGDRFADRWRKF